MKKQKINIEEYRTLRNEILQYLQNYQNIRNMMYLVSLTMLGFFINQNVNPLYFLSPSVIIIPSYFATINYWQCSSKISTYISVFFEKDNKNFNWEKRNFEFGKLNKHITKMDAQLIPYIAMQFFCILLYFIHINYSSNNKCLYIIIGIVSISLSLYIFHKYNKDMGNTYTKYWEDVKKKESN